MSCWISPCHQGDGDIRLRSLRSLCSLGTMASIHITPSADTRFTLKNNQCFRAWTSLNTCWLKQMCVAGRIINASQRDALRPLPRCLCCCNIAKRQQYACRHHWHFLRWLQRLIEINMGLRGTVRDLWEPIQLWRTAGVCIISGEELGFSVQLALVFTEPGWHRHCIWKPLSFNLSSLSVVLAGWDY